VSSLLSLAKAGELIFRPGSKSQATSCFVVRSCLPLWAVLIALRV